MWPIGWREEDERMFNPEKRVINYFDGRRRVGVVEDFRASYTSYVANVIEEFVKQHRKYFAKNIQPTKIAERLAKKIDEK